MQKIQPCLWFDKNCEEAINFYVTLFPNSSIKHVQRYPEGIENPPWGEGMSGKIVTAIFELDGYAFQALDGGPTFTMNPSVSFFVNFDPSRDPNAKEKLDAMWAKLSEGAKVLMPLQEYPFSKHYGWIQDRFGVSWQLILTNPDGEPRPSIVPSMLFVGENAGKAEEAAKLYTSVFKNSKMGAVARYPAGAEPDKEGTIMFEDFMLKNQWFAAMDSAHKHDFQFSEAISYSVETVDQAETDYFWDALIKDGGSPSQCGWLKDKFGFSWQISPKRLAEMLSDPDKEKSNRAMEAMLQMTKIDIAALEKAYNG